MPGFVVAIDGYAGSGKSTTARAAADRLGFLYLDTGAMYRAFTLRYLERGGGEPLDLTLIKRLLKEINIDLIWLENQLRVMVDGRDVSSLIRSPAVNNLVSQISAVPEIREYMVRRQREIAQDKNVVCEGRDITTVVFPDAAVKIYMDADLQTRAQRRQKELQEKGIEVTLEDVMRNLKFRDDFDSHRPHSPLRRAADSILLDTTNLTIEEEIERVVEIVKKKYTLS